MAETTVPTTTQEEIAVPATREESRYLVPPVDIFETEDQLTVIADLPGVSKETVDIRVENKVLTIKGAVDRETPGESLYREFELARYYRQFQLSDEVNVESPGM
jgi:HSP20 family molecular chaperone IbpA